MKHGILLIVLLWYLVAGVSALEVSGTEQVYQEAERYGIEDKQLSSGLMGLGQEAAHQVGGLLNHAAASGARMFLVALLCSICRSIVPKWSQAGLRATDLAGALGVTALAAGDMRGMIGLGRETIARMEEFSETLLPVLATLMAATGHVNCAAVRQGATVLFSDLFLTAMDRLLIPMVYAYVAACCAWSAVGNDGLRQTAGLIRGAAQGGLIVFLLAFVGWLTASGAIAGTVDAAAIKTAKMAMTRAVPVVGSILADASEAVLVGAGALKGTVGAVGLLTVLAICLTPFLQLSLHYAAYKVTAALTGMVAAGGLCQLIGSIGTAFGLVLGMTGACAVILLMSIVSAVLAVAA